MVSFLQVAVLLVAVTIVIGLVVGAIYYYVLKPGASGTTPRPPVPPVPGDETVNIEFYNGLSTPVIVIRINGTATDAHNPRWTSWPVVFDQADPTDVVAPHGSGPDYKVLQVGETGTFPVLTAGMASAGFIVRVNCDPTSQICDMGDSVYVQGLDGPTRNDLYRDKTSYNGTPVGQVPFKPAIDTRVEFTFGCAYQDTTLCGVNPSCITDPTTPGCAGLTQLMADNPTASFGTDGLLYKPNGSGGFTNIPLPAGTVGLAQPSYFDISCVDGFTVPMILQVRRPSNGITNSSCTLRDGAPLDSATGTWQTLASTAHLADIAAQCPTDEVLWPAVRVINSTIDPPGDGYNRNGGVTQFPMPWVTQATPGAPAGTKLLASFTGGAPVDLHMYRNPLEVRAAPNMGWSVNNLIGCASPCSILTQVSGTSQMYPKTGGTLGPTGHFSTATYLAVGETPFASTDRGVSEVCCKPAPGANPVIDSNKQCNTSTWWASPGIGPAPPTAAVVQYNFGFYVNDFAPSPGADQPWWNGTTSINPYAGGPQDKYVSKIRAGASGQLQTTRAYSYAHDDAWNTIVCGTLAPSLIPDSRGAAYARYHVRVTIGTAPPP